MVVWESDYEVGGAGADYDLFSSVTTDAGSTWSTPSELYYPNVTSSSSGHEHNPYVTSNGVTHFYVVSQYEFTSGDPDISLMSTSNNGETWSIKSAVDSNNGADGTYLDLEPVMALIGSGRRVYAWKRGLISRAIKDYDIITRTYISFLEWGPETILGTGAGDTAEDTDEQVAIAGDPASLRAMVCASWVKHKILRAHL